MINKYFDHVYLLNLEKRRERFLTTDAKLKIFNIEYTRFGATDGSVMRKLHEKFSQENHYFTNSNYIACAISHLSIYADALEKGYNKILILEDDVLIHKDNTDFLSQVPENWKDLLYLGFIPLSEDCSMWDYRQAKNFISSNVFIAENLWGLYSYGITASLMEKVLDVYDKDFPMELDRYFVKHIQPNHCSYGISPQYFAASDGFSDNSGKIETGMPNRSIDSRFSNIYNYL